MYTKIIAQPKEVEFKHIHPLAFKVPLNKIKESIEFLIICALKDDYCLDFKIKSGVTDPRLKIPEEKVDNEGIKLENLMNTTFSEQSGVVMIDYYKSPQIIRCLKLSLAWDNGIISMKSERAFDLDHGKGAAKALMAKLAEHYNVAPYIEH